MANSNEIKARIGGISDTKKITDAMYMISSAKMRRAIKGLEETSNYLFNNEAASLNTGNQIEEALNNLDQKITDYLVKISANSLSEAESEGHNVLMHTVTDLERIGDHFENILEFADYKHTNKLKFTDEAIEGMSGMFTLAIEALKESIAAIENTDKQRAHKVLELERKLDKMERQLRKQHIVRLNNGTCIAQAGLIYVDILSNLERVGDHAKNIAETIIGEQD